MPRAKSIVSTALVLALVAGLAWSGREAGKRMARAGWFHRDAAEKKAAVLRPESAVTAAKKETDPQAAANALRRLMFLSEGSVYLPTDWETLAEVQSVLGSLSAAELAEILNTMRQEVLSDSSSSGYSLSRLVLAEWVKKDPAAALLAGFQNPRLGAAEAFASWAMGDPATALDWLESDGFPAGLADKKDGLRAAALRPLLGRDFDRATAEFLKLPAESNPWEGRAGLMAGWANEAVHDPTLRERLVAFAKTTGRPEDHAHMNHSLLREWPQEDALGMLTYLHELRGYLESADLPAEKRPTLEATAVGAAIYREYDRPALEWWMERYGDRPEVPGPLQDAMIGWRQKDPDKVNQWFAEQPPSPQRDALQASLVPTMIALGKMADAAQAIGNIGDPDLRQSAIERLDYVWSRRDPAAAAAWRGNP